jgi:hypothetical protein
MLRLMCYTCVRVKLEMTKDLSLGAVYQSINESILGRSTHFHLCVTNAINADERQSRSSMNICKTNKHKMTMLMMMMRFSHKYLNVDDTHSKERERE